jgi:hypothetical protein
VTVVIGAEQVIVKALILIRPSSTVHWIEYVSDPSHIQFFSRTVIHP